MREKGIYKKQHKRDKRYFRRLEKPEVKKYRYDSESEIQRKPEVYHNYGYDENNGKTLPPKKKMKRGRCNLSEIENNGETEEEEEEDEYKSMT